MRNEMDNEEKIRKGKAYMFLVLLLLIVASLPQAMRGYKMSKQPLFYTFESTNPETEKTYQEEGTTFTFKDFGKKGSVKIGTDSETGEEIIEITDKKLGVIDTYISHVLYETKAIDSEEETTVRSKEECKRLGDLLLDEDFEKLEEEGTILYTNDGTAFFS